MSKPEGIVVCVRAGDGPMSVPGSTLDECANCGTEIIVSPATRTSIEEGVYPDELWCIPCAMEVHGDA